MNARNTLLFILGVAAAGAANAACDVSLSSILPNGQAVLKANCGAVELGNITWQRDTTTIAGPIDLSGYIPPINGTDLYFTTPLQGGTHYYTATANAGAVDAGTRAVLTADNMSLTVVPTAGGSVASGPAGIDACTSASGTCTAGFLIGSAVSLTATPASGYVFSNWAGDCSGNSAVCALSMSGNRAVAANFSAAPVNGQCGSASGVASANAPVANLCTAGSASGVTTSGTNHTWSCNGAGGGSTAACTAPKIIPGVCGPLHGGAAQSSTPSDAAQLCNPGTPSAVTSASNQYLWTCTGINGGASSGQCAVSQAAANGVCGSANGGNTASTPTGAAACSTGSVTGMTSPAVGGTYSWTCAGTAGGGNSPACSANQTVNGACGSANGVTVASAPNAGLCVAGTSPTAVSGSGPWTWGCNGVNGGSNTSASACSAPVAANSGADPGRGQGLWQPPGTSNIFVADQMGADGAGVTNFIPGCINQQASPPNSTVGCAANSVYGGVVSLAQGNVLSIRFNSKAVVNTFKGARLSGGSGGSVATTTSLWISDVPPGTAGGNYEDVPSGCKVQSAATPSVYTYASGSTCTILPNHPYYVNVRAEAACSGSICRYQLEEIGGTAADLY